MRSQTEIIRMLLAEAEQDDRIRAVTFEGSGASEHALHDKYSDVDVTFFVRDVREFAFDRKYPERFGDILILQTPDDWDDAPYDAESRASFAFLTQYRDGSRIDLTVFDVSRIAEQAAFSEPRIVLLNKDGFPQLQNRFDHTCFYTDKPSAFSFFCCCNEFRWVANYAAKGLCRGQLLYAKQMTDVVMMVQFRKMLCWCIGARNGFSVSIGAHEKYAEKFLSAEEVRKLRAVFAGAKEEELWDALFAYYDFFADLAREVAEKTGFAFDEKESADVRAFLERRKAEK